jgi:hypothetical protein
VNGGNIPASPEDFINATFHAANTSVKISRNRMIAVNESSNKGVGSEHDSEYFGPDNVQKQAYRMIKNGFWNILCIGYGR